MTTSAFSCPKRVINSNYKELLLERIEALCYEAGGRSYFIKPPIHILTKDDKEEKLKNRTKLLKASFFPHTMLDASWKGYDVVV